MLRLLLVTCILLFGYMLAGEPTAQSPSAVELADTEPSADHGSNNHPACDLNCFGCGHSVHDMCPSALLPREAIPQHPVLYCVQVTLRQGHRNLLLRPPITPLLQLA